MRGRLRHIGYVLTLALIAAVPGEQAGGTDLAASGSMTNVQFQMTNGGERRAPAVELRQQHRLRLWSFAIGIWSFPRYSRALFPNDAGYHGGQFLVATDELRDPRFVRTVVYLVHHDAESAMGLVINRPLKDVPAADLLEDTGLDATGATGRVLLHYGGPVHPGRGFILHSPDYQGKATQAIGPGVALTADARIVDAIGRGKGPKHYLLALGYAGWAAGQLEAEIAAGAWEVVPADAALLFDAAAETKWERAMARRMIRM